MNRVDERDTIFSRMNLDKNSSQYNYYYSQNSNKIEIDNELRALPNFGEEGSVTYNKLNSPIVNSTFEYLSHIKKYSEGTKSSEKIDISPKEITTKIKELGKFFGAKIVGVTKMEDYHYYTNRGREKETYGDEVIPNHLYGIAFAVDMNQDFINTAPQLPESIAVVKGYLEAANIGMVLSYYIRSLGYDARNHMDGNYLVIAPLVAQDAGIGQLGRHGLLITKEYGPRVRLGVVTTNIPLLVDTIDNFGVDTFCEECGRCAKTCPGKCIPKESKSLIDGDLRWKINPEQCYKRWRSLGTDCGICLANCPFSDSIPLEIISQIKDSKEIREKILNEFQTKYGIRPFNRDIPSWLK
ncbi:reductive dehalogenase domain-containing protein [Clostridium sediminicola]|uniref:4Fe-4S dicluster domain-containing protein n=1 Tax=Clostridium sediminicola TaxID=3114879 RepID=UPI0031F2414B